MKKTNEIILVYDARFCGENQKAKQLERILLDGGFNRMNTIRIESVEDDDRFVDSILDKNAQTLGDLSSGTVSYSPQLIISVNMAGFRTKMSDGSPYINKLPINILVWIDTLGQEQMDWLEKRINITTTFLTDDPAIESYISEIRQGISVEVCRDWNERLIPYLDNMDCRFDGV